MNNDIIQKKDKLAMLIIHAMNNEADRYNKELRKRNLYTEQRSYLGFTDYMKFIFMDHGLLLKIATEAEVIVPTEEEKKIMAVSTKRLSESI